MAADPRLGLRRIGADQCVVIDFSSPNVAKPMHIAHIRSTIIGDALRRTLVALGWQVIADNHLGDWGTQFGKLIVAYRRWLDAAAYEADPVSELLRLYAMFNTEEKRERAELGLDAGPPGGAAMDGAGDGDADEGDEAPADARVAPLLEDARRELVKLQSGDAENVALWRKFIADSRHVFERVFDRLGVHFDHWLGESAYHAMLPTVVADLAARGHRGGEPWRAGGVPRRGEADPVHRAEGRRRLQLRHLRHRGDGGAHRHAALARDAGRALQRPARDHRPPTSASSSTSSSCSRWRGASG